MSVHAPTSRLLWETCRVAAEPLEGPRIRLDADWAYAFVAHAEGPQGRREIGRSAAWTHTAVGSREAAWRALYARLAAEGWEPVPDQPGAFRRRTMRW